MDNPAGAVGAWVESLPPLCMNIFKFKSTDTHATTHAKLCSLSTILSGLYSLLMRMIPFPLKQLKWKTVHEKSWGRAQAWH